MEKNNYGEKKSSELFLIEYFISPVALWPQRGPWPPHS
jgi:hypothetical protein